MDTHTRVLVVGEKGEVHGDGFTVEGEAQIHMRRALRESYGATHNTGDYSSVKYDVEVEVWFSGSEDEAKTWLREVVKSVARSERAAAVKPFIDLPYDFSDAPSGVSGVEITLVRGLTLNVGNYESKRRSFGITALVSPSALLRQLQEIDGKLRNDLKAWAGKARSEMDIPL